MKEETVRFKS